MNWKTLKSTWSDFKRKQIDEQIQREEDLAISNQLNELYENTK